MKVSATQKHARMSPRKIRPYARMVQGMSVVEAQHQLTFAVGKAPGIILEVLKSAVANAKHNAQVEASDLKIASILVNQGLVMKRFMPAAKGMAHAILKRTAHVTVIVEGDAKVAPAKKAASKKTEAIKTLTPEEFAIQEKKAAEKERKDAEKHDHDHDHEGHEHLEKHDTPERDVATTVDKQSGTAFQKVKMNQKGGNAKKTHRRKSIG